MVLKIGIVMWIYNISDTTFYKENVTFCIVLNKDLFLQEFYFLQLYLFSVDIFWKLYICFEIN